MAAIQKHFPCKTEQAQHGFKSSYAAENQRDSKISGLIGQTLGMQNSVRPLSSRELSTKPTISRDLKHTDSYGRECLGVGGRFIADMEVGSAQEIHPQATLEMDAEEDMTHLQVVYGGSRPAGQVHGKPTFTFSLGEGRGGRSVDIADKERSETVTAQFADLKNLLGEKRPISYNITHHRLTAYVKDEATGMWSEKKYALNFDSDVLRLLKDNGVAPTDKEAIDKTFSQLAKINETMREQTKHETTSNIQHWSRNEIGDPTGSGMMITDFHTVNRVLFEKNHRKKFLKERFCDPSSGFVTTDKKKKIKLTAEGSKVLQRMHEADCLRNSALLTLQEQVKNRRALIDKLKSQKTNPTDESDLIPAYEREIRQIQSVMQELEHVSQMEIDRTFMLMEGRRSYQGGSSNETGRQILDKGDNRYTHWLANQSAGELSEIVSKANGKRTASKLFKKTSKKLTDEERTAIAGAASLLYHVNDSTRRDESRPLSVDHLMYHQEHGSKMTKKPTAEIFLYRGAQFACGERKEFSLEGLGLNLPKMIDKNGRDIVTVEGGDQVRGGYKVRREDGAPVKGSVIRLRVTGEPVTGKPSAKRLDGNIAIGVPQLQNGIWVDKENHALEVNSDGHACYFDSDDMSQEILLDKEMPGKTLLVDSEARHVRVPRDVSGHVVRIDAQKRVVRFNEKGGVVGQTFEEAMRAHLLARSGELRKNPQYKEGMELPKNMLI